MATNMPMILFLLLLFQPAKSQEFFYSGFKHSGQNITVNGDAEIEENGVLRLTKATPRLIGHAFYSNPFLFKNLTTGKVKSFSCAFAFSMAPQIESLGGHGMALVISRSKEIPGAFSRQYLGLVNTTDNGNSSNHIFAVEFDTVQDIEFGDINDNHVGIDINSLVSNASANAAYFRDGNTTKHDLNLKSGKTIQAWADYDGTRNVFSVTLSLSSVKPNRSILSFRVDLSPLFQDYMFVGFSASTGLLASSHYVKGWSFKMDGEAQSLDLSSLPSILKKPKNKNSVLILVVSVSTFGFVVFLILLGRYVYIRVKNRERIEDWEMDVGPHRYSYAELKQATKGFRDKELLGFGGFGRVYRGILAVSNVEVAVKKISHESTQGLSEFVSEIATIGRLRHRNLVQLLGWCRRGSDLLLVYDFMPNGSLDKWLFHQPEMILSWKQRFKIVRGVASGLLYLHEEWEQTVIHRDIKAGNVLLDDDLNGRLGDFGLAKLYEHGSDPSTTRVVGTLGYLAPELTKTGKPTTASDVFAFGALLMEVVCGRRPIEQKALPEELILVDWIWDRWKEGAILEVVDPRLDGQFDETEVVTVLKLALMCSYNADHKRPGMRQVVRYLEGETPLPRHLASPDVFEDYVHSYSGSSLQKKEVWPLVDEGDDDDEGANSATPLPISRSESKR